MLKITSILAFLFSAVFTPALCQAAGALSMPGPQLTAVWTIPFVCMLLSIAIMPLAVPHFWHHHYGKVALFWGLTFLVPCIAVFGPQVALYEFLHTMLLDYVPFLILIFALFTVAGGVRLTGSLVGTPVVNVGILVVGTLLASWMGTTGAAMLLIRPLLRANAHRKYKVHTVVFFIFLVANIGGSLTPLGDPPLFLGFLKGVTFFWTMGHLLHVTALLAAFLLAIYLVVETILYRKEGSPVPPMEEGREKEKLGLDGKINLLFLLFIILAVLMSGMLQMGEVINVYGIGMEFQNVLRDLLLILVAFASLGFTSQECRDQNGFSWEPIVEVGKLFFGIFVSMIPTIHILRSGTEGALSSLINLVSKNGEPVNYMYFWLTGLLSSFLDNAPTYLVFFNTAGGDATTLMGPMASTLAAISAGAVFMGANSYIGNAPNFMVLAISKEQGVPMPSFFGYMVWSFGILTPCFAVLTFLFFM